MLQAEYENEAMDDNKGTVENEAMEVASNNGSALESAPSLRPTSEPNKCGIIDWDKAVFAFTDGQQFPS
ncbi:hypothetical protein BV898_06027 [Hypsibius exemplaris]|uniref:Uncharacterized protein n=1 Tax=Hypsibius exemplaris TaxID=2072580 RepID=A0A1W0WXX6_HYPEX|nr:hypothetical protein BV898_06027 [Hypsibius exemplaris]